MGRGLIWMAFLANLVVVVHLAFIAFAVFGGLLALRWPAVAWVHLPTAIYGVCIEFVNVTCPLTPLEVWLRRRAGETGYEGGFIDHYIVPLIYPAALTRRMQILLGLALLFGNAVVYWWAFGRARN